MSKSRKIHLVAGTDEAGRGPLAGPVVCAAVILNPDQQIIGLADSKKLSASKREQLELQIKSHALSWSVCVIEAEEIDRINILQASLLGMQRAVCALSVVPQHVLVDGKHTPKELPCPATAIIQGDASETCISAASILAKVARDRIMQTLHLAHPQFGFDKNMGYPTATHRAALKIHGPCPAHRRSFAPVKASLQIALVSLQSVI